jgi:hypothetical protein
MAEMQEIAAPESEVVPGRVCGTCTLCCKVVAVTDLHKQPGVWCPHCVRSKGCGIYETRPKDCRTFFCHWMVEKGLSPEWKPERAKFALVTTTNGVTAFVDPGFPGAWRVAPFYETLKRWAVEGLRAASGLRIVTVRIGARVIVVLPNREVDMGPVGPDEMLRLHPAPNGDVGVEKVKVSPVPS